MPTLMMQSEFEFSFQVSHTSEILVSFKTISSLSITAVAICESPTREYQTSNVDF